MPRIHAPTVAEHRAQQRRALLDAARELLAESGVRPTVSAVAARTGLARPSVYQYFASAENLLDSLVEDVFPRWSREVSNAMTSATDPGGKVLAYVETNLRLVAEGEHALATALAEIAPGPAIAEKTKAMHAQLLEPLTEALSALRPTALEVTAEMVNALVHAGSRLIESGWDVETVWNSTRDLLSPYLSTLVTDSPPHQGIKEISSP